MLYPLPNRGSCPKSPQKSRQTKHRIGALQGLAAGGGQPGRKPAALLLEVRPFEVRTFLSCPLPLRLWPTVRLAQGHGSGSLRPTARKLSPSRSLTLAGKTLRPDLSAPPALMPAHISSARRQLKRAATAHHRKGHPHD